MPATSQVVPLLTTAETAARLALSEHTIRSWAKSGKLPAIYLTERSLRFRVEDVEALIDEHERAANE
jgi:excisionase family DNA binding protein